MGRSIETTRLVVRSVLWPLLMAVLLSAVVQSESAAEPPAIPTPEFAVLDGEPISAAELAQGRWGLGFVILPGCPACEQVITWFALAGQAFPQVNFLLVTRAATPEFISFVNEHATGMRVLLDSGGFLGARLGVTRAPTAFLVTEGAQHNRLDWPFTQQQFLQALEESIRAESVFPDPSELLGQPAPEFTVVDLAGTKIALADLPRPLLLSFFDPHCPPCWDVLPMLVEASTEVSVAILAFVGEEGLAAQHRVRFTESGMEAGRMTILLLTDFQVIDAYQVTATPTTILIDRKGVITWTKEGLIDEQDLRDHLRTIAAEED